MSILDAMYKKRFCVNSVSNKSIDTCLCGHYYHSSCILKGKLKGFEGGYFAIE